jgi:hypothetical protein
MNQIDKYKNSKFKIGGIFTILILIALLCAGCISDNDNGDENKKEVEFKITASELSETNYGWIININSVEKGSLPLNDAGFQHVSKEGIISGWNVQMANPPAFKRNESTYYAIPWGDGPVKDKTTDNIITNESKVWNYIICYIVYVDTDSDNTVSADDSILIYKDANNDGSNEIIPTHKFWILDKNSNKLVEKEFPY